ncbi:hypothetical protein RND71_019259 [Anisodus tanguticus]|uniref:Uncharacterized protein n=1 Tax=Anisodus tanguticus TaxID=243964 RepID=A0AAE1V993_9SOLA|nr:hypothetical protein RND71_019259 [Anisodus tanguticus]
MSIHLNTGIVAACHNMGRGECGSFAYLRVELGDLAAFIAAGNILLEYVIGSAAMARSWTSYFATTLCGHQPDDFRIVVSSLAEGHNRLDPIAIGVCLISYKNIDVNAPFSVAFEAVGLGWGKYVVAAGTLKGIM